MPVPGSRLEAEVLLWREIAIVEPLQADGEEDGAHHHVKAVEAGRHEEGGTIDAALEAERRVIIFKRLNGAEHHAKPDGAPQALLRALAVAMAQRGMRPGARPEDHTSELQSLMRISYAVFCLQQKKK